MSKEGEVIAEAIGEGIAFDSHVDDGSDTENARENKSHTFRKRRLSLTNLREYGKQREAEDKSLESVVEDEGFEDPANGEANAQRTHQENDNDKSESENLVALNPGQNELGEKKHLKCIPLAPLGAR